MTALEHVESDQMAVLANHIAELRRVIKSGTRQEVPEACSDVVIASSRAHVRGEIDLAISALCGVIEKTNGFGWSEWDRKCMLFVAGCVESIAEFADD